MNKNDLIAIIYILFLWIPVNQTETTYNGFLRRNDESALEFVTHDASCTTMYFTDSVQNTAYGTSPYRVSWEPDLLYHATIKPEFPYLGA